MADSFQALRAVVNRVAAEVNFPAGAAAELFQATDAYAKEEAAAAWREGYGQGRDDEAGNLPLKEGPP